MEKFSSHFFLKIVLGVFFLSLSQWIWGGCRPFFFVNLSQAAASFSILIGHMYYLTAFPLPRLQTRDGLATFILVVSILCVRYGTPITLVLEKMMRCRLHGKLLYQEANTKLIIGNVYQIPY